MAAHVFSTENLVEEAADQVNVLVANLDEDAPGIREEVTCDNKPVTKVRKV